MSRNLRANNTRRNSLVEVNDQKQTYTCDICQARLSRPAHLERHRLVHSADSRGSFACQLCDKRFNRKDIYLRHKRGVHGLTQPSQRPSLKKSCRRCIRYKLRCSREIPCTACSRKGAECFFDGHGSPLEESPDQCLTEIDQSQHIEDRPIWNLASTQHETSLASAVDAEREVVDAQGEDHPQAELQPQSNLATAACSEPVMGLLLPTKDTNTDQNMHVDVTSPEFYHNELKESDMFGHAARTGTTQWQANGAAEFRDAHMEYQPLTAGDFHTTYQIDGIGQIDSGHEAQSPLRFDEIDRNFFRASRIDWLGSETDFSDQHTSPAGDLPADGQSTRPDFQNTAVEPMLSMDLMMSTASAVQELGKSIQNNQTSTDLPGIMGRDYRATWPGVLDHGGNETWPFDYASNKGFRKIQLPPLRQVLEQTVEGRPSIEKTTVMDLIKVLSAPNIPLINESPALEALPAIAFLGQFMKIYFAEFHAVLPVIHVPTWRIEKCSTALLAAMACIGALYSTAEGSSEVSTLLAEITQRALFWMGQADTTSFRNPEYITASCFHQIYSLGSGNRRLYELADASRGHLVTSLRGLGVLKSDSERDDAHLLDLRNLKSLDAQTLEATWLRWRDREIEKRVAWSVFEYDCTLSTLTSKRGVFSIAELPGRLPCDESLWEAHSAQAWASMVSFANGPPTGFPTQPLLRDIIAHKPSLTAVPAWAKRICAQAVGRLLWDLRELEDVSSPEVMGMPFLAAGHQETKRNLLQSLTELQESVSRPTCTSDIVNMNITCLVTHYSYLNSGHDAMDLVVYIFRNSGQKGIESVSADLNVAKEHLRYVFAQKPSEARQLVRHAACIIGTARECTIFTPCETMRVFMGFAFLLAFNKFSAFHPVRSSISGIGTASSAFKLDDLSWKGNSDISNQIDHWIKHGGVASLGPVSNICDARNFKTLKDFALITLQGLRVWGLSGKFYRTLKNFT